MQELLLELKYPGLQLQNDVPGKLIHIFLAAHDVVTHSSISVKKKKITIIIKVNEYSSL